MIHEVIVLDHSGPDLALILYAGALKLALFAALVVAVFVPRGCAGKRAVDRPAAGRTRAGRRGRRRCRVRDGAPASHTACRSSWSVPARSRSSPSSCSCADMQTTPEFLLLLVVLTDFAVLGTTRLSTCIRALAVQGLLLGLAAAGTGADISRSTPSRLALGTRGREDHLPALVPHLGDTGGRGATRDRAQRRVHRIAAARRTGADRSRSRSPFGCPLPEPGTRQLLVAGIARDA